MWMWKIVWEEMYKVCCYWSRQWLYPAAFVVLVDLEIDFFLELSVILNKITWEFQDYWIV